MNTNRTVVAQFSRGPWIEIVWCRGRLADGLFRMKVHGRIQEIYAIDVTPHLNFPKPFRWQEVARVTNVLGAVEYEDPYLPNVPQRFYRARSVR